MAVSSTSFKPGHRPPGPKHHPTVPKGTRMAWRGTWGSFEDGRSRLSALARRIRKELAEAYVVERPLDARRLRLASQHLAMVEFILHHRLSKDTKGGATRKAVNAHQGAADRFLAQLTPKPKVLDLAQALAALRTNGGAY